MDINRWMPYIAVQPALIGGERVDSGSWADVVNPSCGGQFDRVAVDPKGELARAAIEAARDGSRRLEAMSLADRAKVLLRASEVLEARKEEVARLLATEGGKPIRDARVEVSRAISLFRISAEEARFALEGRSYRADAYEYPPGNSDRLLLEVREPIGIVGAILPFNFPANSFAHKVAPNIAAGNAVVVKPAPATPLSALLMGSMLYEAGLPKGALSVVPGPASTGEVIVSSDDVAGITFTGSTSVGLEIASKAAARGKRVMMEMGGSDPMLVFEDADVDAAAAVAARARFEYAGQNCNAAKRILVHEAIYEEFMAAFVAKVKGMRVGDALDESTDVGPVISGSALRNVEGFVEDALSRGAKLEAGGGRVEDMRGFFFEPTVISGVAADARCMVEEVFGPVAPVYGFSSEEEALEVANSTPYGLQSSVFTRDVGRALRVARRLRAGAVMLNDSPRLRWDALPFGGVKLSGLGAREGVRSTIEAMTDQKLISLKGS